MANHCTTDETIKHFESLVNINAGARSAPPRSFNLWLTICHPESADEAAGEVAIIPVEFADETVIIDLIAVTRIDSWGIAIFLEAMQRISEKGGRLVLVGIQHAVRQILETARLDSVFCIYSRRELALAELGHRHAA